MSSKLSDNILELYKEVTGDKEATYDSIIVKLSKLKVNEPMLHTSEVLGKIPINDHILESDVEENDFEFVCRF